ncbi:MAG TPA: MFS transporter [Dehalococcoidia bacterium]|nr:MFS transporter [Dehalococcoidia bacterium]
MGQTVAIDARSLVARLSSLAGGAYLFERDTYLRFWLGRLTSHTAANAVLYALLILVVRETGSAIHSSLFVVSYILPSAVLGSFSGVLADRVPKGLVLFGGNLARGVLAFLLIGSYESVWTLYGMGLLLALASQFISPAEGAALPLVVPRQDLTAANAANNLGSLISQVAGMAVLAPLFLALFVPPLFLVAAVLFFAGAVFFGTTLGFGFESARGIRRVTVREVREQFARAWRTLSKDTPSYMSVIIVTLASVTALVTVSLAPRYVDGVLHVAPQWAIFVLSPAALGILGGMRLAPGLERFLSKAQIVALSFGVLVLGMVVIGMVKPVGAAFEDLFGLNATGARLLVTSVFAVLLAGAYTLINIAARSIVNERVPVEMQGRVFAAQVVLSNLASIAPILLTGAIAQVLGADRIFVAVGVVVGVAAVWYWLRSRYSEAAP